MRPHQLLPLPPPSEYDPSVSDPDYFYKNVLLPLNKDFVRIMSNGILIDYSAAEELRITVTAIIEQVQQTLNANPIIQEFQNIQYSKKYSEYLTEMETKKKTVSDFIKPYKPDDVFHRTYVVNTILEANNLSQYTCSKWTIADIKQFLTIQNIPILHSVMNKTIPEASEYISTAMQSIAEEKMRIYNKSHYDDKVSTVTREKLLPPFNPGSSTQKKALFSHLGIEPLTYSDDTGEASWGRDQIEEIYRSTPNTDTDLKELLQCFVDHSYSAIIKNNFMEAFDKFTVDGRLYGNLNLFGTKTARPTSNSPNLLNMPSTGSIYSKPLKKCFVAPDDFLIYTADLSALEDRVIANLSGDTNKCNIFLEGLDGHSLNAVGYFPDRLKPILGENHDNVAYVKEFMRLNDEGNKEIKTIRQEGKGPTFGLAYGAYPAKIAATIKCTLLEAETIFNNYHNVLYPGITKYREEYVLPTAIAQGYLHLGLGCRLYTDNPDKDIRTLNNATIQFWSILTLLAVNELHHLIDESGYQNDIRVISTIYDSIYIEVRKDPTIIKWLNDTLIPLMCVDFIPNTIVHNDASGEIGPNWANLTAIPQNATIDQIKEIIYDITN